MNFEEHAAKPLLAAGGIAVPEGELVTSAERAAAVAARLGPCVVKAQVPTGSRGRAGGVLPARTAGEARAAAARILGMEIGGYTVERVLVEAHVDAVAELYAAVINDPAAKVPVLMLSTEGGMAVEELAAAHPDKLVRLPCDIRHGIRQGDVETAIAALGLGEATAAVAEAAAKLYRVHAANDAELVEINPLAVTAAGAVVALDCKFVLDDAAVPRQAELATHGAPDKLSEIEARGRALGLTYIELDGNVGVLANGAGLTMATMDAVRHFGGRPANFLEIGGEAYRLGKPALDLVLSKPGVRSLVINFCGAFARTDVMTLGVVEAWHALTPSLPVFFSIHGTGEDEAVAIVRGRLGLEPFDLMDDAVKAAVLAAR